MKITNWVSASMLSAALVVPTASASLITFDFTQNVQNLSGQRIGPYHTFSEMGLDMKVSAMVQTANGWSAGERDIWLDGTYYGTKGLGVKGPDGDNWEIDGYGPNEGLKFHFDTEVQLVGIQTWFGDYNDDWNLMAMVDGRWSNIFYDKHRSIYAPTELWTSNFLVWANDSNDSLTVKKIMVDHKRPVASVPEPATIVLLALGILGLVTSRKHNL